ncbi:MAG: class I SAM-dependent methyltransferase [Myxococcales bacterium]|nr:class I SAM-dependent methyltransferase [Myxococcales bacterium]
MPSPSRPLYERWPYPDIPVAASIPRPQLWQLHLDWMRSEAGVGPGPARPRVWVAGCGTWQAYPIARANPTAEVLATDVSEASLRLTRRRLSAQGVDNVRVAYGDLDDGYSLPDGPFDWIECFGVLMNLADPATTLRGFAERLAPGGLVRLMVYPWFGRRRVFQVARIAALLGLGYADERHPSWLAALMKSLPESHPLRFTFEDYADSANPAGIVDGFLHMSGVAFSAHELYAMVDAAGLELAFAIHRPWGDPWVMGPKLDLDWDPWAVLYWLDLWQELKSNFIVVLRRKGEGAITAAPRLHPLLNPDLAMNWADSLRLLGGRAVGLSLQDRQSESGRLSMSRSAYEALVTRSRVGRLLPGEPLVLFGERPGRRQARGFAFVGEAEWRRPRLYQGRAVPHPAWEHQIRVCTFPEAAGLSRPADSVASWEPHANPLEDDRTPYGFSPLRTLQAYGARVDGWLSSALPEGDWTSVRLPDEAAAFREVRRWAGAVAPQLLGASTDEALRELWALTFGYRQFVLDTDADDGA